MAPWYSHCLKIDREPLVSDMIMFSALIQVKTGLKDTNRLLSPFSSSRCSIGRTPPHVQPLPGEAALHGLKHVMMCLCECKLWTVLVAQM